MLNECYNQITPSVKVSDLCQLVNSGHLEELRHKLSQMSDNELEYIHYILDERGSGVPGDDGPKDEEFYNRYDPYGKVRRAACDVLMNRDSNPVHEQRRTVSS